MDSLPPGQNLGPYRIIGQIGQGGMATVYRAYHAAMDRDVAVKILPRQLAEEPEFLTRFQQEARTIARLEHVRILPVYDFGESDGLTYLVMRYLEAGTLKDLMKAGALAWAEVDRLFTQLAEALQYAHAQGVIHRDLKPSNVLVDAERNLFLTDFGIAKLLEGGAQLTNTGALMGTPAYTSPEQAQGDKVDQRTDIYSLGIILYEMTTGRVPFEADTPLAVVLKQISAPLPLPSVVVPNFPPAIERVLLKALAKEAADRFANVAEFLAAWKAALPTATPGPVGPPVMSAAARPTVTGRPAEAPAPVKTATPRAGLSPKVLAGLALAGLAVLGGLAVVMVLPTLMRPNAAASLTPTAAPRMDTAGFTWQSWTSLNRVLALAARGTELYAAGPGAITVWDAPGGMVLRRYTSELPNPIVHALWVEEDGTLWAATDNGLARLNPGAERWAVYADDNGLDSDTVTAITRLGDQLVVGTRYGGEGGGLNLFDGQRWTRAEGFPSTDPENAPAAGLLANSITALLAIDDAVLWVGTEAGLGRWEPATGVWTRFTTAEGLPDDQITALYVDAEDGLWVGTRTGGARFDGAAFTPLEQAPPGGVFGITQDAAGRYYFSGDGGVWRFDPALGLWEAFTVENGAVPVYTLFAALNLDGRLYFGTDGAGVLRYVEEAFDDSWYAPAATVATGFGRILALPNDELWFVEEGSSYPDRYRRATGEWAPYTAPRCGCIPLAVDAQGSWWGNDWPGGLRVFAPDGGERVIGPEQGLPAEAYVNALAFAADGATWLGTEQGVFRFDGERVTDHYTAADAGFASDQVRKLWATADGAVWAAGEPTDTSPGALSRFAPDGAWTHFTQGTPFGGNFSRAISLAEDAQGAVWVGTDGDGAWRLQDGQWRQFTRELPSPYVRALTRAPDGQLWFGTDLGAVRFDGQTWTTYGLREGLINARVLDIRVEADGGVWFATGGGVSRYGP